MGSEMCIRDRCKRLGKELTKEYAGKDLLVIGALKGAVFFLTDLVREMDVPLQMDFMDVSSYGDSMESSGKVRLDVDVQTDVKGRDVLIVEDIVDTGHTMKYMKDLLASRGANSVKCCALLNKTERRVDDVDVEYYGSIVENEFVVGYGLDLAGRYRNLPFVGVLKPEIIAKYTK